MLVRLFGVLLVLATGVTLLWAATGLPAFGEAAAPAANHVAEHYLEHAFEDSGGGFLLLRPPERESWAQPVGVNPIARSVIMDASVRAMVPISQLYALYVVFHGHYSPGGGFQGGALLAGSILLQRITMSPLSRTTFPRRLGTPLGVAGLLIFGGVGLAGALSGGRFLDYAFLPFGMEPAGAWMCRSCRAKKSAGRPLRSQ